MVDKKKIKKSAVSRRHTKKKSQKPAVFNEFKKILVGIGILASVCLTVAMIADIFFHPGHIEKKSKTVQEQPDSPKIKPILEVISDVKNKKRAAGLKNKSDTSIKYEVFNGIDHTIIEKPIPPVKDHMPKIAIIIDDIGYDKK